MKIKKKVVAWAYLINNQITYRVPGARTTWSMYERYPAADIEKRFGGGE